MAEDPGFDVGEQARGGRPVAPGDLPGRQPVGDRDLAEDLQSRIAELDAIAWNLPVRRRSPATARDGRRVADD